VTRLWTLGGLSAMNQAYKKECWLTLVAFLVTMFLTHFFPVYFAFKGLTEMTVFGFPAHYFLTLVVGWLVLMPLYWLYINMSEQIDREIEETTASEERKTSLEGSTS